MSIFLEQANAATAEELKSQGAVSNAIKTAGTHDLVIKNMFETDGGTWKSMTVEFASASGETVKYSGFFGTPKSTSAEDVDKAAKQTKRTTDDIARIVKAAGIPDIKVAAGGATTSVDAKGRAITTFPKVNNKKLIGTTTTFIDGQKKDGQVIPDKVFVKQELDTYKFLTKDGKDPMGRDCKESYDSEAKTRIEIAYGYEANPKHVAKLAELQEKQNLAVTATPGEAPVQAQPSLSGMPTATVTTEAPLTATPATEVIPADDDI